MPGQVCLQWFSRDPNRESETTTEEVVMPEHPDEPTYALSSDDTTYAKVVIDFSRVPEEDLDPSRPLLVATMLNDEVIAQETVIPAEAKDPRRLEVTLALPSEDGLAAAHVVVAPADDERNLHSDKVARTFVSGRGDLLDAGVLHVSPVIYGHWRLCWFPHTYRVTGRVVRTEGDCTHPVGAARVELYDVDYCWWWYDEDLVVTTTTDADGFFDVQFKWCVPLYCILRKLDPPLYVDPHLRDRLREIVDIHFPKPPPPPDGPVEWEDTLRSLGVQLRPSAAARSVAARPLALTTVPAARLKTSVTVDDLFGNILHLVCDDPCDARPDIRIRVKQDQPGGAVEIYQDSYAKIHRDLAGDLLNLKLEANELALYEDSCRPDPLLGNCMVFERVGAFNVSTIYEPDIVGGGASYGTTPAASALLGRTVASDRGWCLTPGVHGDFGMASHVDYYQVELAKWTAADVTAWNAAHEHVPTTGWAPVAAAALGGFSRTYLEQVEILGLGFDVWRSEPFSPHTVAGIPGLYKSRQRFEQEYRDSHGGLNPARDFVSGWSWDTQAMTRLFDLDTTQLTDGLYSFRIVGYRQTGVDGTGEPILALVDMGLADGVAKRCGGTLAPNKPELLTLRVLNDPRKPVCGINALRKNGVETVGECDIIVLEETDSLEIDFEASDARGELDSYWLTIQKGSAGGVGLFGVPGVTVTGRLRAGRTTAARSSRRRCPRSRRCGTAARGR
jgi:hypothetical protein